MDNEIKLANYKDAYRKILKEKSKKNFLFHLIIFLLISFGFFFFNITCNPDKLWSLIPIGFWLIFIVTHYFNSVKNIDKEIDKEEKNAEEIAKK